MFVCGKKNSNQHVKISSPVVIQANTLSMSRYPSALLKLLNLAEGGD